MNILILDETLTQVSIITNYISLDFIRNYNEEGSFKLEVNLNQNNADELDVGRIIYIDPLRCGIIESVSITRTDNKSGEVLMAYGIELKDVIKRRITVAPNGEDNDEYIEVTTENIVRSLIDRNLINPDDTNRKMDVFVLGSANGLGEAINFKTVNINLANEIYGILLPLNGLGLKCEVDLTAKTAEFSVHQGKDRTLTQTENPTAVFSLKLGTSIKNVVAKDMSHMKNLIYAGDGYIGAEKTIVEVYDDSLTLPPSGVGRVEDFKIEKDAITTDELVTVGKSVLKSYGSTISVAGLAAESEPSYDLGDKITFIDYKSGESMDLKITMIKYTYEGVKPAIKQLYFGSAAMSIAQAINTKYGQIIKEFVK